MPNPTSNNFACAGRPLTLTAVSGSLQSLNYLESSYPTNTDCVWNIECPEGSTVIVSFTSSFRLAGRMPRCPRSRLLVYSCGQFYGPYCHLTPPTPFITACSKAQVNFIAGSFVGVTRTGFKLNYICKPTPRPTLITPTNSPGPTHSILCGGGPHRMTNSTGHIQTLHWPLKPYPLNQKCRWTIHCLFGMEISFDKNFRVAGRMPHCAKDQLTLAGCGSQLGTFCHLTAPSKIFTLCPDVEVLFHTGEQRGITRTGFRLNYRCF